jgi:hypothetical protein
MAQDFDRGRFDAFGLESPFAEMDIGEAWQGESPSPRKAKCTCGAGARQGESAGAGDRWMESGRGEEGLAGDELAWLDPQFEGEAYEGLADPWQGEDPPPAGRAKAPLGGDLWTSRLSGTRVTTYLSPAALGQSQVEVLVYVHGLLNKCRWPTGMKELICKRDTNLAQHAVASGRPLVLVIPEFQDTVTKGAWRTHGLDDPAALDRLIAACLAEAGRRRGAAAPVARNVIVAGHSRAYDILYPLVRSLAKAPASGGPLAALSEIWMIDASYPIWGGCYPACEIEQLAALRPGLKVRIVYRKGSNTDVFKHRPAGGVEIRMPVPSKVDHCEVPSHALPALLSGASALPAVTREDAPAESWGEERSFDEQWNAPFPNELDLEEEETGAEGEVEDEADFIASLALAADEEGCDGARGEEEYSEWPDLEDFSETDEGEDPVFEAELTEAQTREYDLLVQAKAEFENKKATFEDVYELLKARFGSIDQAVEHYKQVETVDFYSTHDVRVHVPTMGARLKRAKALISVTPALNDVLTGRRFRGYGLLIRRNRNAKAKLSNHSAGQAIDLDGDLNPNLDERAPARALYAITGEGFFLGETAMRIYQGGTALALLPLIRRFRTASDTFKSAFATCESVEAAMQAYIFGGGNAQRAPFEPTKSFALIPYVEAIVDASGRRRTENKEALRSALAPLLRNLSVLSERRIAETGEVKAKGSTLKQGFAVVKQLRKDLASLEARRRQSLVGLTGAARDTREAAIRQEDGSREINWAIDTLIEIWLCYRDSFEPKSRPAKGERPAIQRCDRKKPQTPGNRGTIAANGYFNLPPELVAALIGTDGGGLTWLGVSKVKDMMHFDYPNP